MIYYTREQIQIITCQLMDEINMVLGVFAFFQFAMLCCDDGAYWG